jgi:hypothetical protein
MNLCEPVLEKQAVFHSYACRKEKGRLKAIAAAENAARANAYYLKLDIRKYFESISHDILVGRLQRVFKDPLVLHWLEKIIRGHRHNSRKGLPIGSLTSQHLANFYLNVLDRFCQEYPTVRAYVRYMDDFVCWGNDRHELQQMGKAVETFLSTRLELQLKHPPCIQPTSRGMDYLGYRIFPHHTALNRRSKVHYAKRLRLLEELHSQGRLESLPLQQRLTAITAFVLPVRSHYFRRQVMTRLWSEAIGHEPGEPGRQLEQQREQLPRRKPQQQHPVKHEQQQRLSCGPQLRPQGMDFPTLSMGLNRPRSCSSSYSGDDKMPHEPSGASSPADAGSNALDGFLTLPLLILVLSQTL